MIEFLVDRNDLENPLFELLSARIRDYEKHAPEFRALNQCLDDRRSYKSALSERFKLPAEAFIE